MNGKMMANPVFVFGSNLAGRHGKGAALEAKLNHGAVYGGMFEPEERLEFLTQAVDAIDRTIA